MTEIHVPVPDDPHWSTWVIEVVLPDHERQHWLADDNGTVTDLLHHARRYKGGVDVTLNVEFDVEDLNLAVCSDMYEHVSTRDRGLITLGVNLETVATEPFPQILAETEGGALVIDMMPVFDADGRFVDLQLVKTLFTEVGKYAA